MRHQLRNNIFEFMFAGNSTFTIENSLTGNHFTFKINKLEEKEIFFVKVLTGSNNETDYQFFGTIFEKKTFRFSKKSKIGETAQSVKSFVWFFDKLKTNTLPACINFYHEGLCGRCGRKLTTPDSVSIGFGPECRTHQNKG